MLGCRFESRSLVEFHIGQNLTWQVTETGSTSQTFIPNLTYEILKVSNYNFNTVCVVCTNQLLDIDRQLSIQNLLNAEGNL